MSEIKIFTTDNLMKAMGLQVGDRIKINDKLDIYVIELNECLIPVVTDSYLKIKHDIKYLIDRKIEILPKPKRVGDLKCTEQECRTCPIRFICQEDRPINNTLYFNLELYKNDQSIHYDQEIYDLLKARLDKEVKE